MKVLVTGGTGFLGSHTVAQLAAAGHEPRVMARSRDRVAPALRIHELDPAAVEVAVGDITDASSVREAVQGCDVVVHAAAIYSYDPRDAEAMRTVNANGARTVLTAALDSGAQRVVHVSSTVALARMQKDALIPITSPVGDLAGVYARSKQESDRIVREFQTRGAPVVRMHPAGILGPRDPHLNETNVSVRNLVRGFPPVFGKERFQYCDVRDCAATLVALAEGRGDDEPAWFPPLHDVDPVAEVGAVVGRRLRVLRVDSAMLHSTTVPANALIARLPRSVEAIQADGVLMFAQRNRFVDDGAYERLGVTRTPTADMFRDTVRWLVRQGQLTPKQAGAAMSS
jgi:nucleoside-diphosphate-sugar epimerase